MMGASVPPGGSGLADLADLLRLINDPIGMQAHLREMDAANQRLADRAAALDAHEAHVVDREAKARATIIKGTEIAERERVVAVKEADLAAREAACRAQENTIAVEMPKLVAKQRELTALARKLDARATNVGAAERDVAARKKRLEDYIAEVNAA
jgi:hypothetical protein